MLNWKKVVMSVSTRFLLLDLDLYSAAACYVHHSLLHVIIHFIFLFVVDKHDFEPSHRCMRTQKAQLSAVLSAPWLSTSRSGGGCQRGKASPRAP